MVSVDVDTLQDLFPGYRASADPVYECALPRLADFLAAERVPATLFVVGNDLRRRADNCAAVRRFAEAGHEIANHTMGHVQGFAGLSLRRKRGEIADAAAVIADATGRRPVGFRAPGWNVDEETLDILEEEGYLYDSSVLPTWMSPLLKLGYRRRASDHRTPADRTTLGRWSFQWAPSTPYRPGTPLWRRGGRRLLEIPIMTVPLIRLPFFGTFSFWVGTRVHEACFRLIHRSQRPLNYELHGVEFVDGAADGIHALAAELPRDYVPATLMMPWSRKREFLERAVRAFGRSYRFLTMEEFARRELLSGFWA
jgi:peptidoglycan/xylan/chitin deacetylase (PgdA/CDA1 family)